MIDAVTPTHQVAEVNRALRNRREIGSDLMLGMGSGDGDFPNAGNGYTAHLPAR